MALQHLPFDALAGIFSQLSKKEQTALGISCKTLSDRVQQFWKYEERRWCQWMGRLARQWWSRGEGPGGSTPFRFMMLIKCNSWIGRLSNEATTWVVRRRHARRPIFSDGVRLDRPSHTFTIAPCGSRMERLCVVAALLAWDAPDRLSTLALRSYRVIASPETTPVPLLVYLSRTFGDASGCDAWAVEDVGTDDPLRPLPHPH